uniref:Uncharacterized protein n=1 Tax=Rhizophora mucronata TaxID=61149 RepID=A0A2P2J2B3_RHIMU
MFLNLSSKLETRVINNEMTTSFSQKFLMSEYEIYRDTLHVI